MSSSNWKRTAVTITLLCCGVLLPVAAAAADSVNTTARTVTEVASGVRVIRHPDAPDGFPQSNTTVIIGDRDVMVIDSCYLPSSAREDIAEIRKWTSKPVRFLVNTHWHYDHVIGNHDYAEAFPGVTIVAHHETKRQFAGYTPGFLGRYTENTKNQQTQVDTGLDATGAKLSDHDREELRKLVAGRKPVWDEFSRFVIAVPDLTFDRELDIDLGNRQVQLRFLGRGNTAGDVVVFLPKEKIVIAGDLVDSPVPYLGGGYPVDEVKTLEAMAALDFDTLVPGHGDVQKGKEYLRKVTALIAEVVAAVDAEIYRLGNGSRNLDAVREGVMKKLDVARLRKEFAGDDEDNAEFFDGFSLPGVITAAYAQRWGK